jgi:hypothetical protein
MSQLTQARPVEQFSSPAVSVKQIIHLWWPLATGWLLMTIEIPALTAVIARAPEPEINLAAWGVTFMVTLILGSPVMMLLSASTALSKDWNSYLSLRRYSIAIIGAVTALHVLLVLTPLYDLFVTGLIGVPAEVVEPARLGLIILIPWAAAVGYRRFNYGVLIRFGRSRAVTVGAGIRLLSDVVVLSLFYLVGGFSGIVMATVAFNIGVIIEAIYSEWQIRPILRNQLRQARPVAEPVTWPSFMQFYLPLVITSLLHVAVQPVASAGLSRMPEALESLAAWPVIFGLLIIFTSAGMAYTEVVVVLLDEARAVPSLRRFTTGLGIITVTLLLLMTATPLASLWFTYVAALPAALVSLSSLGLWITLPMPGLTVLQSWYQGILMYGKRTSAITESVVIFLAVDALILIIGVFWGQISGLYVGLAGMVLGNLARTLWMWYRARPIMEIMQTGEGVGRWG